MECVPQNKLIMFPKHTQGFLVGTTMKLAKKVAEAAIRDGEYWSMLYSKSDNSMI